MCKWGGKNFVTGFAFEGEFVADYPNCLYGRRSEVSIEANMPCEVYVIDGRDLLQMYLGDDEAHLQGRLIAENLFTQTYSRFLDHIVTMPVSVMRGCLPDAP